MPDLVSNDPGIMQIMMIMQGNNDSLAVNVVDRQAGSCLLPLQRIPTGKLVIRAHRHTAIDSTAHRAGPAVGFPSDKERLGEFSSTSSPLYGAACLLHKFNLPWESILFTIISKCICLRSLANCVLLSAVQSFYANCKRWAHS